MSYDVPPAAALPADADGTWSPGRIVTLIVPLARSLAKLHAQGLVHGAVGRYAVRCAPDGRPEFIDEAGSRPRSGATTPLADVRALARLGIQLLDPAANDAARVRAALDAAADGQLDAAGLADRLTASTRAEPLLGAPARRPKPTSHRRVPTRQPRRGLAAMSVALVAVGAFIVIGALSRAPADVSAPHALGSIASAGAVAPVAAAVPVDWLAVVTRLTAMRTTAIVTGKPSLLRRVYVDGAAAAAADVELVRRWQLQQTRVVGFDAAVVSVDLLRSTVDTAVLDVTTELSAYRVVDRRGLAVSRSAAQQQSAQLVLVRRGERWLVRHVRAVEPQSTSAATAASTSS